MFERRLVHECPDAEVGQEQTVEILTGQVRDAATKHDASATETGLQFGQDCFDGPPLRVEIGQLNRWRFARIQNRAEKAVLFAALLYNWSSNHKWSFTKKPWERKRIDR